jgi:hypothetical protein
MMSGSTVTMLSVLLGVLCTSPSAQAFAPLSVPRQQLGSFRAQPLGAKAKASSKVDIKSLVDEASVAAPAVKKAEVVAETEDTEILSSVVLMGIDPLLTLDEKQLERDEKYMRQAISVALSE